MHVYVLFLFLPSPSIPSLATFSSFFMATGHQNGQHCNRSHSRDQDLLRQNMLRRTSYVAVLSSTSLAAWSGLTGARPDDAGHLPERGRLRFCSRPSSLMRRFLHPLRVAVLGAGEVFFFFLRLFGLFFFGAPRAIPHTDMVPEVPLRPCFFFSSSPISQPQSPSVPSLPPCCM